MRRLSASALTLSLMFVATVPVCAADEDLWPGLRRDIFGTRLISESTGVVGLEAPERAEDAALVPMTITLPGASASSVKKLTLIIDQNPAPVAAVFTFGPASTTSERRISTRARVDRYTHVRAVAEMTDGSLHMTTRFVKASGGCSAPASKDREAALAGLGKIKVSAKPAGKEASEAQVMIRHPNFSGLQMDEVTRAYTPARFISELEVRRAGELVLRVEGGISISENPHFTFTYAPGLDATIDVTAKDTDGEIFTASYRPPTALDAAAHTLDRVPDLGSQ